jgi:hypothetical protein
VPKGAASLKTGAVQAPTRTTGAKAADQSGCAVSQLTLLPVGAQMQALLSIVCSATGVDLPARLGLTPAAPTPPALGGGATADVASGGGGGAAAQPGAPVVRRGTARGDGQAAGAGQPGPGFTAQTTSVAGPHPVGAPRGAAVNFAAVGQAIPAAQVSGRHAATPSASGDRHHSWFGAQPPGAQVLLAVLLANLAILGAIALWRVAVRFVIPRFA